LNVQALSNMSNGFNPGLASRAQGRVCTTLLA
jgi:hypothetical protein